MTCRTCRYCIPISAEDGYCHRLPPTLIPPASAGWPPVSLALGYCGEYRWRWWRWLWR